MSPLKVHPHRHIVLDEPSTDETFWRLPILHPVHHGCQNILLPIERDPPGNRVAPLTENPGTWAAAAVVHAGDAEEPVKTLQLGFPDLHVIPVGLGAEGGDLVVLAAVVGEKLAAALSEVWESLWVGLDVEGVQSLRGADVVSGEGLWVPARVLVHDVSKPVLQALSV